MITGRCAASVVAHSRAVSLRRCLRGLVLGAGFAPTEPADGRESGAGGGFVLDSGKVGRAVLLCSLDEWPGDFGTDVLGCVLSRVV